MPQIEEFENYKIRKGAIIFDKAPAVSLGCIGTLDGTSNIEEVTKKCEGVVVKSKKRVTEMTVTLTGYAKIPVSRKMVGLSNEKLKAGVYGYGSEVFSGTYTFVAEVIDMDGNVKYIAFPKLSDTKGLSIKVNNDVTEIEMEDYEFKAMKDENGLFYYEAYESELTDEDVKTKWLTAFTPDLVKA